MNNIPWFHFFKSLEGFRHAQREDIIPVAVKEATADCVPLLVIHHFMTDDGTVSLQAILDHLLDPARIQTHLVSGPEDAAIAHARHDVDFTVAVDFGLHELFARWQSHKQPTLQNLQFLRHAECRPWKQAVDR
jgi:hypothetical protein